MQSTGAYSLKNYRCVIDPRIMRLNRLEKVSALLGSKVKGVGNHPLSKIISEKEFVQRFDPEFPRNKLRSEPCQSYTATMYNPFEVKHNSASTTIIAIEYSSKDSSTGCAFFEAL